MMLMEQTEKERCRKHRDTSSLFSFEKFSRTVSKKMGNHSSSKMKLVQDSAACVAGERLVRVRGMTLNTQELCQELSYDDSEGYDYRYEDPLMEPEDHHTAARACFNGWILSAIFPKRRRPIVSDIVTDTDLTVLLGSQKHAKPAFSPLTEHTRVCSQLLREAQRLESEEQLDAALDCYRRCIVEVGDDHRTAANVHYKIGVILWKRGVYEESLMELKLAQSAHRFAVSSDDYLAEVYLAIGRVQVSMGDRKKARKSFKKALCLLKNIDLNLRSKLIYARVQHATGELSVAQGELTSAMNLYHEALTIQKEVCGHHHVDVATTLLSFGSLYEKLQQYDDASRCYLEAVDIYHAQQGSHSLSVDLGVALSNVGWMYYLGKDFDSAMDLYKQALDLLLPTLGKDHRNVASIRVQIGMVYEQQSKFGDALAILMEALRGQRVALGDEHEDVAITLSTIGSTFAALGRLQKALDFVDQSLRMRRKLLGSKHVGVASNLVQLSHLYQRMGKPGHAIRCLVDAYRIFQSNKLASNDERVLQVESALWKLRKVSDAPQKTLLQH